MKCNSCKIKNNKIRKLKKKLNLKLKFNSTMEEFTQIGNMTHNKVAHKLQLTERLDKHDRNKIFSLFYRIKNTFTNHRKVLKLAEYGFRITIYSNVIYGLMFSIYTKGFSLDNFTALIGVLFNVFI